MFMGPSYVMTWYGMLRTFNHQGMLYVADVFGLHRSSRFRSIVFSKLVIVRENPRKVSFGKPL